MISRSLSGEEAIHSEVRPPSVEQAEGIVRLGVSPECGMNLMTGGQLPQQLVPEHPVPAENQDSHRNASEEPAAVLLEIRRMPIEFLP